MEKLKYLVFFFAGMLILAVPTYGLKLIAEVNQYELRNQLRTVSQQRNEAYRLLSGHGLAGPFRDSEGNYLVFDRNGRVVNRVETQEQWHIEMVELLSPPTSDVFQGDQD